MSADLDASLSDVDREILELLENAEDDDGNPASCLGSDIAACVGVPGGAIGSRLNSLRKLGLVDSAPVPGYPKLTAWSLNHARAGQLDWRKAKR